MSAPAYTRRQLRPVILNGAGDVTLPLDPKGSSAHEEPGKATSPAFALEPPTEQGRISPGSEVTEPTILATSLLVASTGVLSLSSDASDLTTSYSSTLSSTASTLSTATPSSAPSTSVVVVTSTSPLTLSTASAVPTSTSHTESFYVAIALAITAGVAAIILLLAWWTRVRARSRRRWELASRSSSTTNFDLLWQPSRDRDVGEPKRDFSLPTNLQTPSGAIVRDRIGAWDLVNIPKARARPTLPRELQPSESSLRVLSVCTGPPIAVPERPLKESPRRMDSNLQDPSTPTEVPDEFSPGHKSLKRHAIGLGIREPSSVTTVPPQQPHEKHHLPANGNSTWRERLQARRPLPEQPPIDVAFGESWLESIRRRVFVGPDVHVPQNSTDFGSVEDFVSGRDATGPTPTYASHFVTSPIPQSDFHPPQTRNPPSL